MSYKEGEPLEIKKESKEQSKKKKREHGFRQFLYQNTSILKKEICNIFKGRENKKKTKVVIETKRNSRKKTCFKNTPEDDEYVLFLRYIYNDVSSFIENNKNEELKNCNVSDLQELMMHICDQICQNSFSNKSLEINNHQNEEIITNGKSEEEKEIEKEKRRIKNQKERTQVEEVERGERELETEEEEFYEKENLTDSFFFIPPIEYVLEHLNKLNINNLQDFIQKNNYDKNQLLNNSEHSTLIIADQKKWGTRRRSSLSMESHGSSQTIEEMPYMNFHSKSENRKRVNSYQVGNTNSQSSIRDTSFLQKKNEDSTKNVSGEYRGKVKTSKSRNFQNATEDQLCFISVDIEENNLQNKLDQKLCEEEVEISFNELVESIHTLSSNKIIGENVAKQTQETAMSEDRGTVDISNKLSGKMGKKEVTRKDKSEETVKYNNLNSNSDSISKIEKFENEKEKKIQKRMMYNASNASLDNDENEYMVLRESQTYKLQNMESKEEEIIDKYIKASNDELCNDHLSPFQQTLRLFNSKATAYQHNNTYKKEGINNSHNVNGIVGNPSITSNAESSVVTTLKRKIEGKKEEIKKTIEFDEKEYEQKLQRMISNREQSNNRKIITRTFRKNNNLHDDYYYFKYLNTPENKNNIHCYTKVEKKANIKVTPSAFPQFLRDIQIYDIPKPKIRLKKTDFAVKASHTRKKKGDNKKKNKNECKQKEANIKVEENHKQEEKKNE